MNTSQNILRYKGYFQGTEIDELIRIIMIHYLQSAAAFEDPKTTFKKGFGGVIIKVEWFLTASQQTATFRRNHLLCSSN